MQAHSLRIVSVVMWLAVTIAWTAGAAYASVRLPLDGFCRPGRFFPILIDGDDAKHDDAFSADHYIPTLVHPVQSARRVIPMLATGVPTELKWSSGSARLRVAGENEKLIGCIAVSPEMSRIFPGNIAIPILLNPQDLLPGPTACWESLDAIALDASAMDRVSDPARSVLLAAGVTLVCTGEKPPDSRWPWCLKNGLSILSFPVSGPTHLIDQDAYLPTANWTPGWSVAVRWQVLGAAVFLVTITMILLSLRNRFAGLGVSIFLLCSTAAIVLWRHALDPIDRIGGDVLVRHGALLQQDQWVYQRAKTDGITQVPWRGLTHPVFASSSAMDRSGMQLDADQNGDLKFIYEAKAGHTLAFVRRAVTTALMPADRFNLQSPLRELVKAGYLQADSSIVGETEQGGQRWPSVLVELR